MRNSRILQVDDNDKNIPQNCHSSFMMFRNTTLNKVYILNSIIDYLGITGIEKTYLTMYINAIVEITGGSSVGVTNLQILNSTGSGFSTGFAAVGSLNKSQIVNFVITGVGCGSCPSCFSKAILTTNCGGIGDTFTNTPKCS